MTTIILILVTHFVADFIFQTDKQAINKSKSNWWLTAHVASYGVGLSIFITLWVGGTLQALCWMLVNVALHWVTDYVTSRINAYLWRNEMRHWFFVGIGADQLIHYICLLLTYEAIITKNFITLSYATI